MVYHHLMHIQLRPHLPFIRTISLGVLGLAFLTACAPTGPSLRDDAASSRDRDLRGQVEIQRRLSTGADERADQAIVELSRDLRTGRASPERVLASLQNYSINELQWQRLQHQARPELSAWIELALLIQTHKLNPDEQQAALANWVQRWRAILEDAQTARLTAEEWLQAWRSARHGPSRVGVILPSDSALATPGEMIKTGLIDGWLTMPMKLRPQLFFYYVNDNDMAGLYDLLDQAQQDQVEWLLGPLPRGQVEHILANRSARWMLPTLFLNVPANDALLRGLNNNRLAFALNPETDAEQAALLAHQLGLDRALMLSQNTSWGDRVASSFVETFQSTGKQITDQASYDPNRVDHSDLLESVLGLDESKARIASVERILGQTVVAEPQRRDDIDMIFLASRASDAKQIRPQLQFFRAEDLPVVATSHAVDGALDPRRDVDMEGVYLPMAPWFVNGTSQGQIRQSAEARHPELMTPAWSQLYAMGHDLIGLIRWLYPMNKDPDLSLNGMTGRLMVDERKQIGRELMAVQVVNGQSKVLD